MGQSEMNWDKLLKIRTGGRDDSCSDRYHYPYEPTPYPVLERLALSGYLSKKDLLLDYGCGKGRVGFYLSYQTRCRTIGIDFDRRLVKAARENGRQAVSARRTRFFHTSAESYDLPPEVNRCYFFNPFSREILEKVLARIMESFYECPRDMLLFFYYPSDDYLACLMTRDILLFEDEIDCRDLFEGEDRRERILVFRLSPVE